MTEQELTDKAESEAFARYIALRTAFAPCWGAQGAARTVRVRIPRQSTRKGWADWLPASGD
ncbi:MAG: hypothetical protein M3R48_03400 [Candidatus Dormibacteraeota bacterium]|nr:hypothetical protein [Candidatus Dormibacteraeota bacterium]